MSIHTIQSIQTNYPHTQGAYQASYQKPLCNYSLFNGSPLVNQSLYQLTGYLSQLLQGYPFNQSSIISPKPLPIPIKPEPNLPQGQPLKLSPQQKQRIQQLFGLSSPPVTDQAVFDNDNNGVVSQGDTAVQYGGFTGGMVSRRLLNQHDVNIINGVTNKSAQSQLDQSRATWKAQGIKNYRYIHQQGGMISTPPVAVTVNNGHVVNAYYTDTNQPVDQSYQPQTLEGIFNTIQIAINNGSTVEVDYNEANGVPKAIVINREAMAYDGGSQSSISHFSID